MKVDLDNGTFFLCLPLNPTLVITQHINDVRFLRFGVTDIDQKRDYGFFVCAYFGGPFFILVSNRRPKRKGKQGYHQLTWWERGHHLFAGLDFACFLLTESCFQARFLKRLSCPNKYTLY
jgi:hypothetical protein